MSLSRIVVLDFPENGVAVYSNYIAFLPMDAWVHRSIRITERLEKNYFL